MRFIRSRNRLLVDPPCACRNGVYSPLIPLILGNFGNSQRMAGWDQKNGGRLTPPLDSCRDEASWLGFRKTDEELVAFAPDVQSNDGA